MLVPSFDLLHAEPTRRLSPRLTRETLTFAFAAGCGSDPFDRLFCRLTPARTTFSPECFSSDLFLEAFVQRCLRTHLPQQKRGFHKGALRLTLSSPPSERADIELRRSIFRHLEQTPKSVELLSLLWHDLDTLRFSLESADLGKRGDPSIRRLDILRQLAALLARIAERFTESTGPLAKLGAHASQLLVSDANQKLRQLLDYEDNHSTLTFRLRLGRDAEIRELTLLDREQSASNLVHIPWLMRLFSTWSTRARRHREIVGRLIEAVFEEVEEVLAWLLELELAVEFYLALEGLLATARNRGLSMCLPELSELEAGRPLALHHLFNPFLLLEDHPPIPCDVRFDNRSLVVITGPNSGGKTRLLQAVGLVQLLAQSGTWVPAAAAEVPVRDGLFVSLVHEVSADQREGRLGTELLRIRRLFERLHFSELVLLDELCSGTNPSEGEVIVKLVIGLLEELSPLALITTHFLEFAKELAHQPPVPSLSFRRVVLDSHDRPLYQFEPGVASTSLAEKTAERLGVTREALLTLIRTKPRKREAPAFRSGASCGHDGGAGEGI
jgi:DNA mismatch repair protein MutS2